MFAFGAVALVAGAGMLLPRGSERLPSAAALAVLAFGASLVIVSWAQLTKGRSGWSTEPAPDGDGVVTIAYDMRYQRAVSLASALLGLAGAAMAVGASAFDDPGSARIIGVVAALFFGATALVGARSLRRPRLVRLRPDALEWDGPLAGRVRWEDVEQVARYDTFGNPLLGIALQPGRTVEGTSSSLPSMLSSLGRGMTGFEASIALDGLRCDPEALERLVRSYVIRAGGSATPSP